MKSATAYRLVLVTAPELRTARRLARLALEKRLAACANLIPALESHYWWQGKVTTGREVLVLFKTTARRLAKLEAAILQAHPYDTPEFLALPLTAGNARYLAWLSNSVG